MRVIAVVIVAAALALGSCSGGGEPAGPPAPGPVALGIWGSDGANLTVEAAAATLETSCATGIVPVALVAGVGGSFEASGTYGRVGGAPPPAAMVEPAIEQRMAALARAVNVASRRIVVFNPLAWPRDAAVFRGIVAGSTMTLTVRVAGAAADLGPFVLAHGRRSQIILCP